jgi:D-2-hydroxyacid dehydrogenase (NADP+)
MRSACCATGFVTKSERSAAVGSTHNTPKQAEILVIDRNAQRYRDALQADFPHARFHIAATEAEALPNIAACEVLIAFGTSISADLLDKAGSLRWIQALSAGTESVVRRPELSEDVLVTSGSGIHGPQLSEMAAWAMLSLARNATALFDQQENHQWARNPGTLLAGKTVAVVGTGASGDAIRRTCAAFDMRVLAVSRSPRPVENADKCIDLVQLKEHLLDVDFLVLAMATTDSTRNLCNREFFAAMKKSAFFINLSRGDVVVDSDLVEALDQQKIAGAALDVFRQEPLPSDHPFWAHPQILATPHIAGFVEEYEAQIMPLIKRNMTRYLQNDIASLENAVSRPAR